MMHDHFKKLLEGLDHKIDNQGDRLIITVSGDKEKLKTLEKKLNAIKELCCGDGDCCSCC